MHPRAMRNSASTSGARGWRGQAGRRWFPGNKLHCDPLPTEYNLLMLTARATRVWQRTLQITAVTFSLVCPAIAATHTQILGKYEISNYAIDGSVSEKIPHNFEILLDDQAWILRVHHPGDFYSELVGGNGVVFSYAVGFKSTAATVTEGDFPYAEASPHTVPWLAFCSSRYFSKNDPKWIPVPGNHAVFNPDAHIAKAEVTFLSANSKLPRSIRFVTDPERLKTAHTDPHLDISNFNKGMTHLELI